MNINFGSWLIDKKIKGLNVTIDISIQEYWKVAEEIVELNKFQRKKVNAKGNAYSLLKRDLLEGCIMPPIILAVSENYDNSIIELIQNVIEEENIDEEKNKKLNDFIVKAFEHKELLILDGLQRTFTIQSAIKQANEDELAKFFKQRIRVEIYLGLSKMGILYRMFTLNTGQTPMSFRHQLEMLYSDYLEEGSFPDDIIVLKETDEARARGIGTYKYQDVIDLFYSYSTGTSQSMDKETLVSRLKEMEFLENYDAESEDMVLLIKIYNNFVNKINELSNDWRYIKEEGEEEISRPFGTNVASIFGKVQSMTGFGAALSRLIKLNVFSSLKEVDQKINDLEFLDGTTNGLDQLLIIINEINNEASKIGNAQRAYFELAYRNLFNPDSEGYLNLSDCWLIAQEKYKTHY